MKRYRNEKGFRVIETERFKRVYLLETEYNAIRFVEDTEDHEMDRVDMITYGHDDVEPQKVTVYRYSDPNFIKEILYRFMEI